MAQFITRVELHGKGHNEPAYQQLHLAMEAKGFKRTISSGDNKEYNLPPAEYNLISNIQMSDVLELAKQAANSVTINNAVLVSHIYQATWDGMTIKK